MGDPTKLIFVRHGDAVINKPGEPRMLTELGAKQARAAAESLAGQRFAALWSSSMVRAEQTAHLIGDVLNLRVHLDDRLRERKDEDPAPGVTAEDDDDPAYVVHRLRSVVADVIAECRGSTALLVTHGGVISHGLVAMCGNVTESYVVEHQPGNCSIFEVAVDDSSSWTCRAWNGLRLT